LLAIEFPDAAGDGAAGKRTLVVRLGAPAAAALYRAVLIGVYGAIPVLVLAGLPPLAGLGLALSAPLGAWQFWRLGRGDFRDPARWEALVLRGVAMLIVSSAGELAAFVWLVLRAAVAS
jgi:1,4-dihydroxy-2-naphthoate octaprenyltransferase